MAGTTIEPTRQTPLVQRGGGDLLGWVALFWVVFVPAGCYKLLSNRIHFLAAPIASSLALLAGWGIYRASKTSNSTAEEALTVVAHIGQQVVYRSE